MSFGGQAEVIEPAFRAHWSHVVAHLTGFLGDWDLAEEAAQEAFAIAAARWPREGVPEHARAWLITTARRRAIDRIRRERVFAAKAHLLDVEAAWEDEMPEGDAIPDERLELVFTCCHPALALDAQVALTLRTVLGLSTAEIARALLVSEETMKRRLSRAKLKIRAAGIPFAVPSDERLPERLSAVRAVVYLLFNEGYNGRALLAEEAIRLGRILCELMPGDSECWALLALMRLHHARRAARWRDGELVLLADQDRSLYDHAEIAAARLDLERAIALRGRGAYLLQAATASLEAEADVDWPQVAALLGELAAVTGSPVVELGRAVAIAEAGAPDRALELVDRLPLGDYRYLHSTRAELLRRLGRQAEARAAYERALALAQSEPEQRFLERRLAELRG